MLLNWYYPIRCKNKTRTWEKFRGSSKQTLLGSLFDILLRGPGCFLCKCENSWEKRFLLPRASPGWFYLCAAEKEKRALASLLGVELVYQLGEGWGSASCEQRIALVPDSVVSALGKPSSAISHLVLVSSSVYWGTKFFKTTIVQSCIFVESPAGCSRDFHWDCGNTKNCGKSRGGNPPR